MKFKYVVYRLTFPNGKIYIGKDVGGQGHAMHYFGSWNNELVERDFSKAQLADFTLRKEILFESDNKQEVGQKETELILAFQANNPSIGYNQTSRPRKIKSPTQVE